MIKKIISIFVIFFLASMIDANNIEKAERKICIGGGGKFMMLYKQSNYAGEAWKVISSNTCINLISNTTPFISGKSGGPGYTCTVWKNANCGGDSYSVGNSGRNFWDSGAKSMKCPC